MAQLSAKGSEKADGEDRRSLDIAFTMASRRNEDKEIDPAAAVAATTAAAPSPGEGVTCRTLISEGDVDKVYYVTLKEISVSKKFHGSEEVMYAGRKALQAFPGRCYLSSRPDRIPRHVTVQARRRLPRRWWHTGRRARPSWRGSTGW